jgi:hypothetical protein
MLWQLQPTPVPKKLVIMWRSLVAAGYWLVAHQLLGGKSYVDVISDSHSCVPWTDCLFLFKISGENAIIAMFM